jgi:predicted transcriptional regulator
MNAMEDVVSRKTFIEKRLAEGLDDIKRGRTHGPFSSASALIRSLYHEMKQRKKR